MHIPKICFLLSGLLLSACQPAERIVGPAAVVDGDSLEIAGTSIRLFGIDAPEGRQTCTRNGASWPCGREAAQRLRQLVGSDTIDCTQRDIDGYGRSVARCMNGSIDLASQLVLSGLALAYRQYSADYVDEEAQASTARRGLWAGEFTAPWDWRRNPTPEPVQTTQPRNANSGDCLIKGNINRAGVRIYHVPGSTSYADTLIDEARGERWFCNEEQAVDAGWRAPRGNRPLR